MKRDNVIYTCITGNYESLFQPITVTSDFDFICFSNDIKDDYVGIWKICPIPHINYNLKSLSRYVKLLPHIVLPNYEYSVWMDANIQIMDNDFYNYVKKVIDDQELIAQVPHLKSKDIYDEIRNAYYGEKVDWKSARNQLHYLRKAGYPKGVGLYENNIILRKHNDDLVKKLSEEWWTEFCKSAPRDQFSLMYVYWKHNYKPSYLFDSSHNSRNISCLKYHVHPSMQIRNNYYNKHQILRALNALKKWFVVKFLLR